MTKFKYCKLMKDNGNCSKPKPFIEFDYDEIFYTIRLCDYKINDLYLTPTKNKRYKSYRLSNGCPFFEPVDGLEKMLEVVGELVFNKNDYVFFEDEDKYYITRINDGDG